MVATCGEKKYNHLAINHCKPINKKVYICCGAEKNPSMLKTTFHCEYSKKFRYSGDRKSKDQNGLLKLLKIG